MTQFEFGTVKNFSTDRRFGFIKPASGPDVFFHFNDGRFLEATNERPRFGPVNRIVKGQLTKLRDPRSGDTLVFTRTFDWKGRPRAANWGFASQYEQAKPTTANQTLYRVVQKETSLFVAEGNPPDIKTEVLWEGTDLLQLSAKFPRPRDQRYDKLKGYTSIEDGYVTYEVWFERLIGNEWTTCKDPRIIDREVPRHMLPYGYRVH